MNSFNNKIIIKEKVSENLALRDLASSFFDKIEKNEIRQVIIDFKGIKSISRSFAQEYLYRKANSRKNITETNIPENVEKMFEIINEPEKRTQIIDMRTV